MQLWSAYWIASFISVLCCTSADAQSGGAYLGADSGRLRPILRSASVAAS